MRLRALLAITIGAVLLASLQDLFPRLWVSTQDSRNIRFIGSLEPYARPCSQANVNVECRKKYLIPISALSETQFRKPTLGIGFFLTEAAASCTSNAEPSLSGRSATPSMVLESYKIYKTLDLATLGCGENNTLYLHALSAPGARAAGQISLNAVIGSEEFVTALKRTIEFLSAGIYLLFALLIGVLFFSSKTILLKFDPVKSEQPSNDSPLQISWFLFSLFKSGLLEIFFLTPSSINFLFRIQSGISLYSHLKPISNFSVRGSRFARFMTAEAVTTYFLVTYLGFAMTKFFVVYLAFSVLTVAIFKVLLTLIKKDPIDFAFVFSLFSIIECLKALALTPKLPFPSGSLTLSLFTIQLVSTTWGTMRRAALMANINIWTRTTLDNIDKFESVSQLLGSFAEIVKVGRVSFFSLLNASDHRLHLYDADQASPIPVRPIKEVPAGIGHIVTTGAPILHSSANNNFFANLFRKTPDDTLGRHYSMFPVQSATKLVGVIAVSKYRFDPSIQQADRRQLESFLPALASSISVLNERLTAKIANGRIARIDEITGNMRKGDTIDSIPSHIAGLLNSLKDNFGWSGFWGTFEVQTGLLHIATSSYSAASGGDIVQQTRWLITSENVRAPAPLAIIGGLRVSVANVDWIQELISEDTKRFISASGARSICALPILIDAVGRSPAYGMLWLSSLKEGEFDSLFDNSASKIQLSLQELIFRSVHKSLEDNIFKGQLRPDIQKKLMRGENPIEVTTGTLVNVDVAKSTKISTALGLNRWGEFQRAYVKLTEGLGRKYGLVAQMFIWDALFLTTDRVLSAREIQEFTSQFLQDVRRLIEQFNCLSLLDSEAEAGRVVATYGDVSCKVNNGKWEINGQMLALSKKFEEKLKGANLAVAVSVTLSSLWKDSANFLEHTIGEEKILGIVYENFKK